MIKSIKNDDLPAETEYHGSKMEIITFHLDTTYPTFSLSLNYVKLIYLENSLKNKEQLREYPSVIESDFMD